MADGGFYGLNPAQVRELAQKLIQKAEEIQQIAAQVSHQVEGVSWKGPDAEKFKAEWNGQHKAALKKAADSLRDHGQTAKRNAEKQESTSQAL